MVNVSAAQPNWQTVTSHYERTPATTVPSKTLFGFALYSSGEYRRALDQANEAGAIIDKDLKNEALSPEQRAALAKQRATVFGLQAQINGVLGKSTDALTNAIEGQRLDPLSKTLAAYRLAFARVTNDTLEASAADLHLRYLDSSYQSRPRMDIVTGAVLTAAIIAGVAGACAITSTIVGAQSDNKEFHITQRVMWKELRGIFATAADPMMQTATAVLEARSKKFTDEGQLDKELVSDELRWEKELAKIGGAQ